MATQSFINRLFSASGIRAMYSRFVTGFDRPLAGAALYSALGKAFPSLTPFQIEQTGRRFRRLVTAGSLTNDSGFPQGVNIGDIPLVPNFQGGTGNPQRFVYHVYVVADSNVPGEVPRQITRTFLIQSDTVLDSIDITNLVKERLVETAQRTQRYIGFSDPDFVNISEVDVQWAIRRE